MRKLSVKITNKKNNDEITYSDLYVSHDLSFLSGVTDYSYDLTSDDVIGLDLPTTDGLSLFKSSIVNVTRQGFIMYDYPYKVETVSDSNGNVIAEYIVYKDGYYRYGDGEGNICIGKEKYEIIEGFVKIPRKIYVEDGKITLNGETYDADIYLREASVGNYYSTYFSLDGVDYPIHDYEYNKWKRVSKFSIRNKNKIRFDVDNVNCAYYNDYIIYNGNKYNLIDSKYVEIDGIKYSSPFENEEENPIVIDVHGFMCQVKNEITESLNGEYANISLSNMSIDIEEGYTIIAENDSNFSSVFEVQKKTDGSKYVIYHGKRYDVHESNDELIDFVIINGTEYRIFDENGMCCAYIDENPIYLTKNGDKYVREIYIETIKGLVTSSYTYNSYSWIEIDNEKYFVKKNEDKNLGISYETVDIRKKISYKLNVDKVQGRNLITCSLICDEDNLLESEIFSEKSACSNDLSNNFEGFNFYLDYSLFGDVESVDFGKYGKYASDDDYKGSANEITLKNGIKMYKMSSFYNIPLNFSNNIGNDVLKKDLIENDFVEFEKNKRINRIIDMEKDVYYPSYYNGEPIPKYMPLISNLKFNIHFRTRTLDDWKVNMYMDSNCNWFSTDLYKTEDMQNALNHGDLVGFANFTNDDIFYQKSKVGKSFLRLSFFNSPNPHDQVLLHTSTIFLNEGDLYKRYIDNVSSNYYKNMINEEASLKNGIDVLYEYSNKSGAIQFDENKRLSMSFNVSNMFEANESSEGFYVYMFKEYSDNLHMGDIYMKAEFNHAGVGRVIRLFTPSLNDLNDLDTFKMGIPLSSLFNKMYLKLHVVYDEGLKKYCYFIPSEYHDTIYGEKNSDTMTFNLFEIKIKTED